MTDRGDPNDRERLGRDTGSGSPGSGSPGSGGSDRDRVDRDAGREPGRETGRSERDDRDYERSQVDSGHGASQSRGRGWGIAALILSILALLGSFFGVLNLLLAIPALILGIVALRKGSRGLGIAAIVLSLLAIAIGILLTILAGAAIMNSPEFQQLLQEAD